MRVWRYVISVDGGGAPNFEPPATTLTVCKPRIREQARAGNLVIAFNGSALNPREPHSVRWAGVVSEVIPLAGYWKDPRFQGKKPARFGGQRHGGSPDNIYRPAADGWLEQVDNDTHGPDSTHKDIGGKNALVLARCWYFGRALSVLPPNFNLRITGARRGHRWSDIDGATWEELERWLDENVPKPSAPTEPGLEPPSMYREPRRKVGVPGTHQSEQSNSIVTVTALRRRC